MGQENKDPEQDIRQYFVTLSGIQNDLVDLQTKAMEITPNFRNVLRSKRQLKEIENEYASLSEEITLAVRSSYTPEIFEESERFEGELEGKERISLILQKYREPREKHTRRIERLSQSVEQTISNRNQEINSLIALIVSLIAILVSATAIVVQTL